MYDTLFKPILQAHSDLSLQCMKNCLVEKYTSLSAIIGILC